MILGAFLAGGTIAAIMVVAALRLRRLSALLAAREQELRATRQSQATEQTLYQLVTENASDVIVRLNRERRRLYVSPSCREVIGFTQQELLNGGAFDLVHPDDLPAVLELFASFGPGDPVRDATWRMRRKDGSYIWIEARYRYLDSDGGLVVILRDIDARKRAEERLAAAKDRLEHLAMHDALTGLPNRRCFLELLDQSLRLQPALAVLFIDLDRFKPINDVHGHHVGDAILIEIAARIRNVLGQQATVARLGGDEFAALLPALDGEEAAVADSARAIVDAISAPLRVGGMTIDVGAAIGISMSPQHGTDTESLLRTADIAMYHAKRLGGGSHRFFELRMAAELQEVTELKHELRHAMVAGEIVPYFQPLVRMRDAAIIGFEALARWEHPTKGTLTPARFLPIVRACGLSGVLFETVLRQACQVALAWPGQLRLAVNIAPSELQDEELPRRVACVLDATGFMAHRLEIEITETALIHDSMVPRSVLAGLRELGCRIALDDFGRGYCNLYHLRALQFDRISIDRAFTLELESGCRVGDYAAAIIHLGQAIGLELTAKGIEDPAAMQRLRNLGCTYGQGFLFSRPLRADRAADLIVRAGVADAADCTHRNVVV
jgi:diguanylate cyclase (GGDEF)-like protein/PAS domain S-box-containing protein